MNMSRFQRAAVYVIIAENGNDCEKPPSERWSFNVDFFYTCIDLHSDMSSPFGDYGRDASSQLCIDMRAKFHNTCCNLQVENMPESPPSSLYNHSTNENDYNNGDYENENGDYAGDDDSERPDYYNQIEEDERQDTYHRYWPGGERGGTLPVCNLCPHGVKPKSLQALINPFMLGLRPCREVYEMGRLGYIPPEFCQSQQLDHDDRCGCSAATSTSSTVVTVVDVIGTDDPVAGDAVAGGDADFFHNSYNSNNPPPPATTTIDSIEMSIDDVDQQDNNSSNPQQQQQQTVETNNNESSSTTTINNEQQQQQQNDEGRDDRCRGRESPCNLRIRRRTRQVLR